MAQASELRSGRATTPLSEREAQIAALRALADAAHGGDGRSVVLEGSAGLGKTRLLDEGRAIAGSAVMRVLSARGGEFEGDFAYGIVRQLFEPLLATAPPNLHAELLAGAAALVEPLFAASQLAGSQDGPGEGSFAILHGLYWLTANVAFQQPTVLAVDDLHWADTPSLRWLVYLTRRLEGLPLLLVVTTRPPEGESRDPTLVSELIADPHAVAIRPEPLGRTSIAVLARDLHRLDPDDAFCAALEAATGGNPLFIGAVLDAFSREGISPTADQTSRLLEIGAQGVSRAVGLRLARLPSEALALLRAAAILGDGTELRHAVALAELDASVLGPAAATLVRLDLLRGDDPLEYFHPVVRSAVYETLDVVERGAAHRRAGELLLDAGALPENAAAHLVVTSPQSRLVRRFDATQGSRPLTRPRRGGRSRRVISPERSRSSPIPRPGPTCSSNWGSPSAARTGQLRPITCGRPSSSSRILHGEARSRSSWGGRSGSPIGTRRRSRCSSGRSLRSTGGEIPISTSCL